MIIDRLVETGDRIIDLDWYLQHKIVEPSDEEYRDHRRVLRYALNFLTAGATVTFIRESNTPTPDLKVAIHTQLFYAEVTKFRLQQGRPSHPVQKIADRVRNKVHQLVPNQINMVIINNFDIELEWSEGEGLWNEGKGFTQDYLIEAVRDLEESIRQRPTRYEALGGMIFSSSLLIDFVWVNGSSCPSMPRWLANWIVRALPGGATLAVDSLSKSVWGS